MDAQKDPDRTPKEIGYEEFIEATVRATLRALDARGGQGQIRPDIEPPVRSNKPVIIGIYLNPPEGGPSVGTPE